MSRKPKILKDQLPEELWTNNRHRTRQDEDFALLPKYVPATADVPIDRDRDAVDDDSRDHFRRRSRFSSADEVIRSPTKIRVDGELKDVVKDDRFTDFAQELAAEINEEIYEDLLDCILKGQVYCALMLIKPDRFNGVKVSEHKAIDINKAASVTIIDTKSSEKVTVNRTALGLAVELGQRGMVQLLWQYCQKELYFYEADDQGMTALMRGVTAKEPDLDTIKYLLQIIRLQIEQRHAEGLGERDALVLKSLSAVINHPNHITKKTALQLAQEAKNPKLEEIITLMSDPSKIPLLSAPAKIAVALDDGETKQKDKIVGDDGQVLADSLLKPKPIGEKTIAPTNTITATV